MLCIVTVHWFSSHWRRRRSDYPVTLFLLI